MEKPILSSLEEGRVFSIKPHGDGFKIMEECDNYFEMDLSREKLKALAAEIYALAEGL